MMVASRKFYEPTFKARVLDEVREAGTVPPVARKHRLEPSLIYGWKTNETDIRKAARKQEKQEMKDAATEEKTNPKAAKLKVVPPGAALTAGAEALSVDGPLLQVHALGPWLRQTLLEALPAQLEPVLGELLDKRFADIESRLSEMIRRVLKEGIG